MNDGLHCNLFLDCLFEYGHEIGFGCNDLEIVIMILGSGIYKHRPSLSLLLNEISRNKVVVLEGAAGLS